MCCTDTGQVSTLKRCFLPPVLVGQKKKRKTFLIARVEELTFFIQSFSSMVVMKKEGRKRSEDKFSNVQTGKKSHLRRSNQHSHCCDSAASQHTLQHKRKSLIALFCLSQAKESLKHRWRQHSLRMKQGKDYSGLYKEGPEGTIFLSTWQAKSTCEIFAILIHLSLYRLQAIPELSLAWRAKGHGSARESNIHKGLWRWTACCSVQVVLHHSSRVVSSYPPPPQPRLNNGYKLNNYTSGSYSKCCLGRSRGGETTPLTLSIVTMNLTQQAIQFFVIFKWQTFWLVKAGTI